MATPSSQERRESRAALVGRLIVSTRRDRIALQATRPVTHPRTCLSFYSFVVGASEVSGVRANLLQAAYQASEIALRTVKPGVRNWEVTEAVKGLLKEYEASGVKGVEGILSHQVSLCDARARSTLYHKDLGVLSGRTHAGT